MVKVNRFDLHQYVAFSKSFLRSYDNLAFWGASGTSYDLSSTKEFEAKDKMKLVLKDVSSIPEEGITSFQTNVPYAGKRWGADIVLDHVTAKLSDHIPGKKLSSGGD